MYEPEATPDRPERPFPWGRTLGLACLCLALLGLAFGLTRLGPKRVRQDRPAAAPAAAADDPAVLALRARVAELEAGLPDPSTAHTPTDAELAAAQEALLRQDELIALRRHQADRADQVTRDRLQLRLDRWLGEQLHQDSVAAENEARLALDRGDFPAATAALTRALEAQQNIDGRYSRSPRRNPSRLTALQRELRELPAVPLHRESRAREESAHARLESGDWAGARTDLEAAIALLRRLLEEHRQSRFAEVNRLERLERDLISANSGMLHQQAEAAFARGRAAEEAGAWEEAGQAYQEAVERQTQLHANYPGSRFHSPPRLAELEVRRQTVLSRELSRTAAAEQAALNEALRRRDLPAARQHLYALARQQQTLRNLYRQSESYDPTRDDLLVMLEDLEPRWGFIQQQVLDRLRPVPDRGLSLLGTEVPQSLYEALLAGNPSKTLGPDLPVESVTWEEAREFCRRLGWVLGRTVRLPTPEEWRAAVGTTSLGTVAETSWHALNSGGELHPVEAGPADAGGFYHLLGNAAEWADGPVAAETAPVLGGTVRDNPATLTEGPVVERPKVERHRYRSFRVVVD